jgi:hypothetical protein
VAETPGSEAEAVTKRGRRGDDAGAAASERGALGLQFFRQIDDGESLGKKRVRRGVSLLFPSSLPKGVKEKCGPCHT